MQFVPWQLVVKMPPPGLEVNVSLTVTDSTGYKLHAVLSQVTITQQAANWRDAFCELILKIKMTAIFNWPINPLGPPIQPGDSPLTREHIAEAGVLVRELGQVLGHLLREDGGHVAHAPQTVALALEQHTEAWKRAFPTDEHADKIIPLRVGE